MRFPDRKWLTAIILTAVLLLLITFSLSAPSTFFLVFMLVVIVGGVSLLYSLFPGSYLFSIAFANYLAVYSCLFIFFVEENFGGIDLWAAYLGFVAPILTFLLGAWHKRDEIAEVLSEKEHGRQVDLGRVMIWLFPVLVIGAVTFSVPTMDLSGGGRNLALLAAMALIALIVLLVSRDVCRFLLDTGLLFEDFFARAAGLVAPAFVFFTFYSMIVIIFAAIFRLIDRYGPGDHFMVEGVTRDINLQESLYFSLITLSTVGYGDIVPISNVIRIIAGIEIISGVVLLLFGVSEIITYAREHRRRGG